MRVSSPDKNVRHVSAELQQLRLPLVAVYIDFAWMLQLHLHMHSVVHCAFV